MTILFLGVTALLILLLLNACTVGFAMLIAGSFSIGDQAAPRTGPSTLPFAVPNPPLASPS